MDSFEALALVAATLIGSFILDWGWRFFQRSEDARRRNEAAVLLRSRGMEAYTYLASFGADDGELREALSVFDHSNQIVLDRHGYLVGRVLPKVQQGGPGLRLVVDNTKHQ
jgi:hypothetical protein